MEAVANELNDIFWLIVIICLVNFLGDIIFYNER